MFFAQETVNITNILAHPTLWAVGVLIFMTYTGKEIFKYIFDTVMKQQAESLQQIAKQNEDAMKSMADKFEIGLKALKDTLEKSLDSLKNEMKASLCGVERKLDANIESTEDLEEKVHSLEIEVKSRKEV